MRLYCPKSGISYSTNAGYGHGTVPHPVFSLPIKALIKGHLAPFCEGLLNPEQSHLFGCALLAKLPVVWESSLSQEEWEDHWPAVIENLATIAMRYDDRNAENLPGFRITKETSCPQNVKAYISAMNSAMVTLRDSAQYESSFIKDRAEEAILRILRISLQGTGSGRETNKLPSLIAQWAASVGNFPRTEIPINDAGLKMPLREYWKMIIMRAFQNDSAIAILNDDIAVEDIVELLEHCEQNIEVGTLHSLILFKKLRACIGVLQEFRPKKITISGTSGALNALLDDSDLRPEKEYLDGEPKASDYKTITQYLTAKKEWKASMGGI